MARSPNYPSLPLPKAVALAQEIYSRAHRNAIDPSTAYELMGFSGKSGASLSALAGLRQFGMVDGRGDSLRVTDLAERIFNPLSEDEKRDALLEAARMPEFFSVLNQEFNGKIPSENVIKSIAIRKHGFSPSGAEGVTKSYLETIRYLDSLGLGGSAELSSDSYEDESKVDTLGRQSASQVARTAPPNSAPASPPQSSSALPVAVDTIEVPLTKSVRARVIFDAKINATHIERLIKILETLKDSYEDEEPISSE